MESVKKNNNETMAVEIIADLKKHFSVSNDGLENILWKMTRANALFDAVVFVMTEGDFDNLQDMIFGIQDILSAIESDINERYEQDFKYIREVC